MAGFRGPAFEGNGDAARGSRRSTRRHLPPGIDEARTKTHVRVPVHLCGPDYAFFSLAKGSSAFCAAATHVCEVSAKNISRLCRLGSDFLK